MKAIFNTQIILPDYMIPNGVILIDGEKIVDFGKAKDVKIPEGAEMIDAGGLFTGPGLIDIHTHSGAEIDFPDDPAKAANGLIKLGTTTVLPTLYFSMDKETLIKNAAIIMKPKEEGKAPSIRGLYMEGPYMNVKYGSNSNSSPWRGPIDRKDYMPLLEAFGRHVVVWGIAPEREGIENFVKDALKFNPDVVFSVAHSEALPEDIERLKKYGLRLATHHTNATGRFDIPGIRGVCVDEAVWYNDDIYAEMISDSLGVHVKPYMQRLIRKIKGDNKLILISDAGIDFGETPPEFEEATDILFNVHGEVSGFKKELAVCCRNAMFHTGASICQVFKYASTNPAKVLGFDDLGEIAIGRRANLIMVDALFNVKNVIFEGNLVK